jgi:hypothetical protein
MGKARRLAGFKYRLEMEEQPKIFPTWEWHGGCMTNNPAFPKM